MRRTQKEMDVSGDETMPRNLKANALPTEGYGMEVDGKIKSQHATAEEATKAATALKQKYPYLQVKVFDVKDGTRTEVQLAAPSEGG